MIPEGFITSLLDRADIVDVVGRYVTLKKSGRNYMCCCPFHKEKTPSFSVSPSKQFYKCFGCGKSGNAIGFLMDIENLEFPEAVRKLAGFYGMDVPEDRSPAKRAAAERAKSLSDYMKTAADFYTLQLKTTKKAIDYLKRREISGETAARFALGYSPDGWHGLQAVFPEERYNDPKLLEVGLVNEKNGRRYDAFRDRLMFPIRNPKGSVIGFGARTMKGDEQPKYLNSPETPIYHKGSELYGLYEGRSDIAEKRRAIVCEGYMDVIQLSQAGFRESVAALGTSITPEHVKKLFKLADVVYFSFDGDAAGRKAAKRALDAALPVITDLQRAHFVLLPPEHDPDSLIKAEGPEAFEKELERSLPLTNFLKSILLEGKSLAYAEERAKLVAEAKPYVLAMQHAPVLRLALMKEIAGLARLQLEEVASQYGLAASRGASSADAAAAAYPSAYFNGSSGRGYARPSAGRSYARPYGPSYGAGSSRTSAFRGGFPKPWDRPMLEPRVPVKDVRDRMLQCFLAYPGLLQEFSPQIEDEFVSSEHPAATRIVEVWRAAAAEEEETGGALNPASLLAMLEHSEYAQFYLKLLADELVIETPEAGARLELKRAFLDLELERTKSRLVLAGQASDPDPELLTKLEKRRAEIDERIREASKEERNYRRAVETLERESTPGVEAHEKPLSSNPKVRAIQMHLRGAGINREGDQGSSFSAASSGAVSGAVAHDAKVRSLESAALFGAPPAVPSTVGGVPATATPSGGSGSPLTAATATSGTSLGSAFAPTASGASSSASSPAPSFASASSPSPEVIAKRNAARANRDAILAALMADAKKKAQEKGLTAPATDDVFGVPPVAVPPADAPNPVFLDEAFPDPDMSDPAAFDAGPVPEGFNDVPPIDDDEAYAFEPEADDEFEAAAYDAFSTTSGRAGSARR